MTRRTYFVGKFPNIMLQVDPYVYLCKADEKHQLFMWVAEHYWRCKKKRMAVRRQMQKIEIERNYYLYQAEYMKKTKRNYTAMMMCTEKQLNYWQNNPLLRTHP